MKKSIFKRDAWVWDYCQNSTRSFENKRGIKLERMTVIFTGKNSCFQLFVRLMKKKRSKKWERH